MNNKFRNNFLYLFFIFAFFNFINLSNALIISEIMYDAPSTDTGKEWIEIYNETSSPIDLTQYSFIDNGVKKKTNLSPINNGTNTSNSINAGEYAIVLTTNSISSTTFNGLQFDGKAFYAGSSGITFLQDGETLGISGPEGEYKINYTPMSDANGTGETINNISLSNSTNTLDWKSYTATPGATSTLNKIKSTSNVSGTESQSPSEANASSYYTSGYYSRTYTIGDMRVIVPKDIYGIAGGETYFPSIIMNSKKEILKGDFLWSFGDGSSLATSTPKYIYKNPGEYIATIEAQQSGTSLYGIERVIVHIVAPDIIISDYVNEEKNIPFWRQDNKGYIELYNRSNEEVNIGGFYIEGGGGNYQLSKFFIIPAHSKVKIYNNILNLQTLDNPKLLFPNRLVLYDWNDNHNLITATTTPIYVLSNNNSKNSSTTDIILSTSTTIISTTTSTTTQGNIQSINKSINKITQNNIRPKAQSKTNDTNIDNINNVDKPSIPFYKKLLYFLYE